MTPKQALENLSNVAASTNTTLANHQILQQSIGVLAQLVAADAAIQPSATPPDVAQTKPNGGSSRAKQA